MTKLMAINASPRSKWNTGQLVREAACGAGKSQADVEVVDLCKLKSFTGCRSCFACKTEKHLGKCVYDDGLCKTLAKMRKADALILGTPIYFGRPTAGFRALYERLLFQYLSYKQEPVKYIEREIPVLLIFTSNAPAEAYDVAGYTSMIEEHVGQIGRFIGPVSTLVVGDTQQVPEKAYGRFGWDYMDGKAKVKRHDAEWESELAKARAAGIALANSIAG